MHPNLTLRIRIPACIIVYTLYRKYISLSLAVQLVNSLHPPLHIPGNTVTKLSQVNDKHDIFRMHSYHNKSESSHCTIISFYWLHSLVKHGVNALGSIRLSVHSRWIQWEPVLWTEGRKARKYTFFPKRKATSEKVHLGKSVGVPCI